MRRALAALLAIAAGGATAAGAAVAVAGCQTHACDATTTVVDGGTDGGSGELQMASSSGGVVWESASQTGTWLDYPPSGTIAFTFPGEFQKILLPDAGNPATSTLHANYIIQPYVSTAQNQNGSGATSTLASGQLAQITDVSNTGFSITNNSCAEYFLRVVVVPETAYVPLDAAARDARE